MPRDPAVTTFPRATLRAITRAVIVAVTFGALSAGLAACGQRGPLYMPDTNNPDKRR